MIHRWPTNTRSLWEWRNVFFIKQNPALPRSSPTFTWWPKSSHAAHFASLAQTACAITLNQHFGFIVVNVDEAKMTKYARMIRHSSVSKEATFQSTLGLSCLGLGWVIQVWREPEICPMGHKGPFSNRKTFIVCDIARPLLSIGCGDCQCHNGSALLKHSHVSTFSAIK